MTTPLVSFNHLSVSFAGERTRVRAVQEVSFTIQAGQTVGVVGESGCGKSVTAMALMGLLPSQAARIDGGEIRFADRDLLRLKARQMADLRGHQLAMIFQEPMSALNPVLTIGEQLCEPLIRHLGATPKAAWQQAIQLLSEVGLARGDSLMTRYPHQLSGGMLQRIMICIAMALQPELLIRLQQILRSFFRRDPSDIQNIAVFFQAIFFPDDITGNRCDPFYRIVDQNRVPLILFHKVLFFFSFIISSFWLVLANCGF